MSRKAKPSGDAGASLTLFPKRAGDCYQKQREAGQGWNSRGFYRGGGVGTGTIAAVVLIAGGAAIATVVAVSGDDEDTNPSPSSPTR